MMHSTDIALSPTEWAAVTVALKDATGGGCGLPARPGSLRHRLRSLGETLFGWEKQRGLADPRLETLRRFVCSAHAHSRPDVALVPELIAQGFSHRQIEAVAALSL